MSVVTFVSYTGPEQTQREKNLRISQARSHAAKASFPVHRRRVNQPFKPKSRDRAAYPSLLDEKAEDGDNVPLQITKSPSSGPHDPFGSYPVRLDDASSATVQLFEVMWSRLAFTILPDMKDIRRNLQSSRNRLVRESMTDPLLMSAMNASIQNRRKVAHHGSVDPRRYAASAVQLLRARVQAGPGIVPSLYFPIMFLAHFEMHNANIATCRSHLRVLRDLGAEQQFDPYAERFTRAIDSFCAMISLSRPIFDNFQTIETLLLEDLAITSNFALHENLMGKSLVNTALCIVDCVRAVEICRERVGQQLPVTPFMLMAGARIYDLPHQLLIEMPGSAVKEACIISLGWWILYLGHAAWELHQRFAAGEDARLILRHWGPKLLERLDNCDISSPLTLWCAASGMLFAASQDVFVSCAMKATAIASRLNTYDIRQILKQYLWIEAFNLVDDFILESIDLVGKFASSQEHKNEQSMSTFKTSLAERWIRIRGKENL
jgi:hypothetical protein